MREREREREKEREREIERERERLYAWCATYATRAHLELVEDITPIITTYMYMQQKLHAYNTH